MDGYRPPGLRLPGLRPATIEHSSIYLYSIYFLCGLASLGKSIFFSLYTIYQSCHEPQPVMLLMLHAVFLDQLSMKIVLKEGRDHN